MQSINAYYNHMETITILIDNICNRSPSFSPEKGVAFHSNARTLTFERKYFSFGRNVSRIRKDRMVDSEEKSKMLTFFCFFKIAF